MAKKRLKVPKRVGGIKIKKRQRRQLRALARHIDRAEELLAVGTALLAMLGLTHKLVGKSDKTGQHGTSLAH